MRLSVSEDSSVTNKQQAYVGDELELFAEASNWKHYWSSHIKPLIIAPVLEVGAGIGTNLHILRSDKQAWTALEPDAEQSAKIARSVADTDEHIEVVTGCIGDIEKQRLFQSVIYIDVLEHIEDDANEVAQAFSKLDKGGRLIVLAPAHNRLYSPFDRAVGHYRRYNKKMLRSLTPSGAVIEKLYYLDSIGCAASLANASLLRADMPSRRQIRIWDRLMVPISRIVDRLLFHTIGKTVVIVWQNA